MIAQAPSHLPNSLRGFDAERRARIASTALRTQDLLSGAFHTYVSVAQTKNLPERNLWPSRTVCRWLNDALAHVDRVDHEAEEEGYPPIGDVAKRNAKRVLFMAGRNSLEPAVYPSMDGEIALYFKSPVAPAALLILLDNEGGAGCFWSLHGKSERQRHEDASKLPADFVWTRLRALGGMPLSQSLE